MGRPYKGLDYRKATVKLTAKQFDIVRQYWFKHHNGTLDQSESIRAAIDLAGVSLALADATETSTANLLDIAEVFDRIDGESAKVYAQAIREAAWLLMLFNPDTIFENEDGKVTLTQIREPKRRGGLASVNEMTMIMSDKTSTGTPTFSKST